jgi:hypothetical protein
MTFTPIPRGTENWDGPVNDAFTALDAAITSATDGALVATNNLSDLTNTTSARAHLGLTKGAAVDSNVFNVLDHGAVGDGTTDDSAAFNAAIALAVQGDVVYVPPGTYALGSPVVLSLGVTLAGSGWNSHFTPRTNLVNSYIRPIATGFTGTQLIRIDPAPVDGSYLNSAYQGGPRIKGLALSGYLVNNVSSAAINAIEISSGVHDAAVIDVTAWQFTGDGVKVTNSSGITFNNVISTTNTGNGFNFITGITDTDILNCYSQGNGGDGYVLPNPNAVKLMGCRSEFNAGYGYKFTGLNYSSSVTNCNTDRSGKDGFYINCLDGGHPLLLVGCEAKRDGSDGSSRVGFNLVGTDSTTQCSGAVLTACNTYVGRNDDGSGTRSPLYGVQTANTRTCTIAGGGWIEGTSGPYNDLALCLIRYAGVRQVTTDATTGVQTLSNSDRTTIVGNTGAGKSVQFWTRGGGERWEIASNSTAEAGSNAGSDLDFTAFNDAGTTINIPLRITRSTGNARFLGNVDINTVGRGLQVAEGTNAKSGVATLTAGAATVANTSVTSSSRIQLTSNADGGTPGWLRVSARSAGTSFTITSSSATDTSSVAWFIVEPG